MDRLGDLQLHLRFGSMEQLVANAVDGWLGELPLPPFRLPLYLLTACQVGLPCGREPGVRHDRLLELLAAVDLVHEPGEVG